MPIQFLRHRAWLLAGSALFLMSACSKNETAMNASPTATPIPSPSMAATAAITPRPTASITPLPTSSPFADAQTRLRDLESQMDKIFVDSFASLGSPFGQNGFGLSVDLREQKDKYVARVYVPSGDASKVNATIENGALHITLQSAQAKEGASNSENSEQTIALPQPIRADQMKIDRKTNVVVITIPKANVAVAAATPAPSANMTPAPYASPTLAENDWDQRMFDEMKQMQTRMDDVFRNAFPNDLLDSANMLRLGATANIEDEKDKYVVHFTLPERDAVNVNVKFENGRLTLTAREEKNSSSNANSGTMESMESGSYEQMIALPGPVKDSEMKVERKAGGVVVTLPKA